MLFFYAFEALDEVVQIHVVVLVKETNHYTLHAVTVLRYSRRQHHSRRETSMIDKAFTDVYNLLDLKAQKLMLLVLRMR